MPNPISSDLVIIDQAYDDANRRPSSSLVQAKIAYAGLLIEILKTPKTVLQDESLDKVTSPSSIARITARNAVRAELRGLVGEDLVQ